MFNKLIRVECMSWSNTNLFYLMVEVYLHILPKVQLHSSPIIVWVIKSRRMGWAGHVERMGEERGGV